MTAIRWPTYAIGIDVKLRRKSAEVLGAVGDPKMVFRAATQRGFAGKRLLKYLVPWGDTVFNQAQVNDLQADIVQVKDVNSDTVGCAGALAEPTNEVLTCQGPGPFGRSVASN